MFYCIYNMSLKVYFRAESTMRVYVCWEMGSIPKIGKYKHNADPDTKVPGPYIPTQCSKWIFIISVVLVFFN